MRAMCLPVVDARVCCPVVAVQEPVVGRGHLYFCRRGGHAHVYIYVSVHNSIPVRRNIPLEVIGSGVLVLLIRTERTDIAR